MKIRDGLKIWWRPSSKILAVDRTRSVSTLELFCDLAFVVYISKIAHSLSSHMSTHGFFEFIILFAIGWMAWFNSSLFHDLHGNDDIKTRVMTFLQVILVSLMAVFSHGVEKNFVSYEITYAILLLIQGGLWFSSGLEDKPHRKYSTPYSVMLWLSAVFSIVSIFLPTNYRFIYLTVSLGLAYMPLIYIFTRFGHTKDFIDRFVITNALAERYNLFLIIVLGESLISATNVLGNSVKNYYTILVAVFSLMIACGLWWIYFSAIGHGKPKKKYYSILSWFLSHMLVALAITLVGISLSTVNVGIEKYLMVCSIIAFYILVLFQASIIDRSDYRVKKYHVDKAIIVSSIITLLSLLSLNILLTLGLIVIGLYLPVFTAFFMWIRKNNIVVLE